MMAGAILTLQRLRTHQLPLSAIPLCFARSVLSISMVSLASCKFSSAVSNLSQTAADLSLSSLSIDSNCQQKNEKKQTIETYYWWVSMNLKALVKQVLVLLIGSTSVSNQSGPGLHLSYPLSLGGDAKPLKWWSSQVFVL